MMVSEELLVARAQAGDAAAMNEIVALFDGFAVSVAKSYFDVSSDDDDLRQEALIGIVDAVRDYRPGAGRNFRNFVRLCVERHVIDFVKRATRKKHLFLTHSTRVVLNEEGDEVSAVELVPAGGEIVDLLADRADLATVVRVVSERLTPLERTVLLAVADGERHVPLQRRLGIPMTQWPDGRPRAKSVENAWQRAQEKIRVALAEADAVPLDVAA